MLCIISSGIFDSHLTMEHSLALQNAQIVFLQTERSYLAQWLKARGMMYRALDELYEGAQDFDDLNAGIAREVVSAAHVGSVVYAALGTITPSLQLEISRLARLEGVGLTLLPGISCAQAAAAAAGTVLGASVYARDILESRIDVGEPLAVAEIDSFLLAGEVKLALLEYYPADRIVQLAVADEAAYSVRLIELSELDRQDKSVYSHTTCLLLPATPLNKLSRYSLGHLEAIMDMLRGEGGCPWDNAQTHESLIGCLIEESYEVVDAIRQNDDDMLCEELGDLLLQVVFHAKLAKERSGFTMRDVTSGICEKLIYRHPHIFLDTVANTPGEVMRNWEDLKAKKKEHGGFSQAVADVPKAFPALMRSAKVQKKAARAGFDWDNAAKAMAKVEEELAELRGEQNSDGPAAREELGDLLFAVVNVARLMGIDAERALAEATDKFTDRFCKMERLATERGKDLKSMDLAEMDALWEQIKRENRTT